MPEEHHHVKIIPGGTGPATADPLHPQIRFDTFGTIRFTIAQDAVGVFAQEGVHFLDPNAPFQLTHTAPREYVFNYENNIRDVTPGTYFYDINLDGAAGFGGPDDPTVVNEPPGG